MDVIIDKSIDAEQKLLEECLEVLRSKGFDYTSGGDRLANFREASKVLGLPMGMVWFVYFFKHYKAIATYVTQGQVESEPIRARIVDCINYLLLLNRIADERETNTAT